MDEYIEWHNEKRKINELVPHAKNPRKLTKKEQENLTESLSRFNLVEIPVINLDGTILAGHQRLKVMALLGRGKEEIDVRVPNRQLTDDEADEYLIRSNKNTGEWDYKKLNEFDADDLLSFGFESYELEAEEDEVIAQFKDDGTTPSSKDSIPEDEREVSWKIETVPEYGRKIRNYIAEHQDDGHDDGDVLWNGIKDYEGGIGWNQENL